MDNINANRQRPPMRPNPACRFCPCGTWRDELAVCNANMDPYVCHLTSEDFHEFWKAARGDGRLVCQPETVYRAMLREPKGTVKGA